MVEMIEILDGRLGKRSVERVRYVINNLLHLVIVKYGDISLVLCISTRLRLVTILSLLVKYLVIFHADPCNKSYISREISIEHPSVGLASLAQLLILKFSRLLVSFASLAELLHLASTVGIFSEDEDRGKYSLPRVQYIRLVTRVSM